MSKAGGTLVELHWTLVTPLCHANIGPEELEALWARAVPATIAGASTRMLSPEDLLLHLCMHASVHHRFHDITLRNILDIAEVSDCYGGRIDWNAFVARANHWGVAGGVRIALMLAQEWADLSIPAAVLQGLAGPVPDPDMMSWVRHKVLRGGAEILNSGLARLETDLRVRGRLAALREAAFPPRHTMALIYPAPAGSWRVLAYYPVRLWDLARRYGRSLWLLLRGDPVFQREVRCEARLREYLGWK